MNPRDLEDTHRRDLDVALAALVETENACIPPDVERCRFFLAHELSDFELVSLAVARMPPPQRRHGVQECGGEHRLDHVGVLDVGGAQNAGEHHAVSARHIGGQAVDLDLELLRDDLKIELVPAQRLRNTDELATSQADAIALPAHEVRIRNENDVPAASERQAASNRRLDRNDRGRVLAEAIFEHHVIGEAHADRRLLRDETARVRIDDVGPERVLTLGIDWFRLAWAAAGRVDEDSEQTEQSSAEVHSYPLITDVEAALFRNAGGPRIILGCRRSR